MISFTQKFTSLIGVFFLGWGPPSYPAVSSSKLKKTSKKKLKVHARCFSHQNAHLPRVLVCSGSLSNDYSYSSDEETNKSISLNLDEWIGYCLKAGQKPHLKLQLANSFLEYSEYYEDNKNLYMKALNKLSDQQIILLLFALESIWFDVLRFDPTIEKEDTTCLQDFVAFCSNKVVTFLGTEVLAGDGFYINDVSSKIMLILLRFWVQKNEIFSIQKDLSFTLKQIQDQKPEVLLTNIAKMDPAIIQTEVQLRFLVDLIFSTLFPKNSLLVLENFMIWIKKQLLFRSLTGNVETKISQVQNFVLKETWNYSH